MRGARNGNGTAADPVPSGLARKRACLLISLIVLVWNAAETGRHFLFRKPAVADEPASSAAALAEGEIAVTARQKFLLGARVDINRAGIGEIGELPGISQRVAEAVIETRERIGGFRKPEDLLSVKGIKEKRLKKILPFLVKLPNN